MADYLRRKSTYYYDLYPMPVRVTNPNIIYNTGAWGSPQIAGQARTSAFFHSLRTQTIAAADTHQG